MGVPFWAPGSAPLARPVDTDWDVLFLDDRPLPGILASLEGDKAVKTNQSKSAGEDGANLKDLGNEPAQLTARLLLWTPQHLEGWEETVPRLQARDGRARPRPLRVSHPALGVMGIRSVFVTKVSLLRRSSTAGAYEVTLELTEASPKKPTGPTQAASKPAKTGVAKPAQPPPSAKERGPH